MHEITAHIVEAQAIDCPSFVIRKSATQVTIDESWPLPNNICDVRVTYRRKGDDKYIHFYDGFCNIMLVESYDSDVSNPSLTSLEGSPSKDTEIVIQESYEGAENLTPDSLELSPLKDTDIEELSTIFTETNQLTFSTDGHWDESHSNYLYDYLNITPREPKNCNYVQECDNIIRSQSVQRNNVFENTKTDGFCSSDDFSLANFKEDQDLDLFDINDDILDAIDFDPENMFGIIIEDEVVSEQTIEVVLPSKENCALEQLMSSDMQSVSKQTKTILFSGIGPNPGQTIQNISYNDPNITCSEVDVGNEVVIESTSSELTSKKKYQCDKCKQIFARISAFRQHMVKEHVVPEKQSMYRCADCGRTFKSEQKYEQHCSGHGNPDLECPKCHKVYASKFSLRAHLKIHERKFACSQCSRTYARFGQYKTHMKKVHMLLLCKYDDCSFIAKKKSELSTHHSSHQIIKSESQLLKSNSQSLKSNSQLLESKPQLLDSQSELLESESQLLELDSKLLDADVESFVNVWDDDVEAIFEVTAGNSKATRDRIKEADLVIEKVLANNLFNMSTDKNEKPRKCNKKCVVCGKKFDRSQDIKRHLIEHVIRSTVSKASADARGTLHLQCEVCRRHTFTKIDQYKCHLREHFRLTIYKCTLCDRTFSDSSNFSKHKKIHGYSHYQCDVCNRKFNTKKMIERHMELHAENQPMSCGVCGKTFYFKSMMNKHMKSSHSSKKMNCRCQFCDEVFKSLKGKWDHQWSVHGVRKDIVDCPRCGQPFRKYTEMKRHAVNTHGLDPHTVKKLAREGK